MRNARYDLLVFEKFTTKTGKVRHKPHKVGAAVYFKGGYTLFIPPGVAISGRVIMVPVKTKLTELDLLEAYNSAADEYGIE